MVTLKSAPYFTSEEQLKNSWFFSSYFSLYEVPFPSTIHVCIFYYVYSSISHASLSETKNWNVLQNWTHNYFFFIKHHTPSTFFGTQSYKNTSIMIQDMFRNAVSLEPVWTDVNTSKMTNVCFFITLFFFVNKYAFFYLNFS